MPSEDAAGSSAGEPAATTARSGVLALHPADLAAPLVLVYLLILYLSRLGASRLVSDDEGSYLYALWRMGAGEWPYCDFLTPQLPGFLVPGAALFGLTGPDYLAARLLAVAATLLAAVTLWGATRRLFGPAVALVAGTLLALHPDIFLAGRVFRADPFMLLFSTLGLAALGRAVFPRPGAVDPPERRWLVAAGLLFGLATTTKLFGPFLLGGGLLWLLVDAWRRQRPGRAVALDLAALVLPCLLVLPLAFGPFLLRGCDVYGAVLGHHLRQGAGAGPGAVLVKGVEFFAAYLRYNENALLVFVALVAALAAWRGLERRALLFALTLPTAAAFLVLSRELFARHLNYLLPALATLFALAVASLARHLALAPPVLRRGLPAALVAALAFAWVLLDQDMGWPAEDGTARLADFIQLTTAPEDWLLADNSELNFYGRRRTTASAASLSAGAAQSGQITWERLRSELEAAGRVPAQVYVDQTETAGISYAQLRYLHDLADFEAWLAATQAPAGRFRRGSQELAVHTPITRPLAVAARFQDGPTLLAGRPAAAEVAAGSTLDVLSAWRADGLLAEELVAAARLVDGAGLEWAAADDSLLASPLRPTNAWRADELTSHRFALSVPPGTPPGAYTLRLGLYPRANGRPLSARTDDGQPLGTSVALGPVRVTGGGPRAAPPALAVPPQPAAGLTLLGSGALPTTTLRAGTVFPLDLWWRAAEVEADLAARVTLRGGAGTVAADTTVPLGVPGTASSLWPAGPLDLRQQVRLPVLANAASGDYTLDVTVLGPDGAPVAGAAPQAVGRLAVEARDLAALRLTAPAMDRPVEARLEPLGRLVGADLAAAARAGETLPVRLAWQALAASDRPYRVTVQLLDETGRAVAQHDGEPEAGARPTTGWLPGEYILDAHPLMLPADLPAGSYSAIAALYDPATLERLPASGADALGDAVRLGQVTLRAP